MLIDRIMRYCNNEYQTKHAGFRCVDCKRKEGCSGSCKNCLEEVHYPSRHPNGKKVYDCPHLINFYVCDYTYKYTTEIYRLMQKSDVLSQLSQYRVLSIGCGGCPDLMAFESYIKINNFDKTVAYRGIDKNPLWKPVHDQISQYGSDIITYINLSTEDVFEFLEQFTVCDINVVVLQYIISALYAAEGRSAVNRLFDLVVESIVKARDETEPFVILINDVNSINLGRDMFRNLQDKLQDAGLHGECKPYYFDRNIQHESQRYGMKHENSNAMTPTIAQRYQDYEPWQFCTSAQLLIEIGGE